MARKHSSDNDLVVSTGATGAAPSRRKSGRREKRFSTSAETSTASVNQVSAASEPTAAVHEPTQEAIAQLAYSYWEARGCQGGCPEDDWTRAEQELRSRSTSPRM